MSNGGSGAPQVRAGVEARVKAAMTHGSRVQAELDGIKAVHTAEFSVLKSKLAELREHSAEQQQRLDDATHQIDTFRDAAARWDSSSASA